MSFPHIIKWPSVSKAENAYIWGISLTYFVLHPFRSKLLYIMCFVVGRSKKFYFCLVHIVLLYFPQRCIKGLVSQPDGETYPDVWGLCGPYADSSVPHEQCHHGLGLQRNVPGSTDCSQLRGETFIKVRSSLVLFQIRITHFKSVKCVCPWSKQRSTRSRLCWRDQHAAPSDRHCRLWSEWNGAPRWTVQRESRFVGFFIQKKNNNLNVLTVWVVWALTVSELSQVRSTLLICTYRLWLKLESKPKTLPLLLPTTYK